MSLNTILATAPLTTQNFVLKANGTTIGNSLIFDNGTNVGIGNTNTTYKLDVSGTGNFSDVLRVSAATGFAVGSIAGYRRIEYTGTTFAMLTNADGYASLNAAASTFTGVGSLFNSNNASLSADILKVQGGGSSGNFGFVCQAQNGDKIFYTNHLTYGVYLPQLSNGSLTVVSGQIVSVSDINLKNDDGVIENALDKICKLTPRYFYWKDESGIDTKERQLGFYAQEVNEALGEEVANNNSNGKWGIYDRALIAMLTKAIQEQQALITSLQEQINQLKNN